MADFEVLSLLLSGVVNAVLIGLIVYVAVVRPWRLRRDALSEFPEVVTRLGMKTNDDGAGARYTVERGGYAVTASVDSPHFSMRRLGKGTGPPYLLGRLSTTAPHPEGQIPFATGNRDFDRYFRKRFASREVAERLASAGDRLLPITALIGKWRHKLSNLEVRTDYVSCGFKQGGSRPFYMPALLLEQALPDIIAMVSQIDAIASQPTAATGGTPDGIGVVDYRSIGRMTGHESETERQARIERKVAAAVRIAWLGPAILTVAIVSVCGFLVAALVSPIEPQMVRVGSIVATAGFVVAVATGSVLVGRPPYLRIVGRRPIFQAVVLPTIFALLPVMGAVLSLEVVHRALGRGVLEIAHHDGHPEPLGRERYAFGTFYALMAFAQVLFAGLIATLVW